jgi:hypothetical protein
MIANFTDNLARPGKAIIAIPTQQLEEFVHQPTRFPDDRADRIELMWLISMSVSKQEVTRDSVTPEERSADE